jgi:hypothetical protein
MLGNHEQECRIELLPICSCGRPRARYGCGWDALRDFFPSLSAAWVQAFFRTAGYPESAADLLAGICLDAVPRTVPPVYDTRSVENGTKCAMIPLTAERSKLGRTRTCGFEAVSPQGLPLGDVKH